MSDSLRPPGLSLPSSSVHGMLQARTLEWVAIPFYRGSSWPRHQTWVSCIAGRFFTIWATDVGMQTGFQGNSWLNRHLPDTVQGKFWEIQLCFGWTRKVACRAVVLKLESNPERGPVWDRLQGPTPRAAGPLGPCGAQGRALLKVFRCCRWGCCWRHRAWCRPATARLCTEFCVPSECTGDPDASFCNSVAAFLS